MMKIAISSSGKTLESLIDQKFGRCANFIIADLEDGKIKSSKALENTGMQTMRGAGVTAAQIVANEGVEAVITGNIGPNAYNLLSQSGIKIFSASEITVRDSVQMYVDGSLKEIKSPSGPEG